MNALLTYLLQVIIASGLLYSYYHLVLRNEKFHRYNRFYLLAATVISIAIPFLNIPVYFTQQETDTSVILQTLTVISSPDLYRHAIIPAPSPPATVQTNWFTWQHILYLFYGLIVFIALLRTLLSFFKIKRIIRNNPVEQLGSIHFVNTSEPGTPFSFFHWLFWNRKIELHSAKGEQVFRHELFHIEQKHTLDILYLELLTAVCWINPFFHFAKKEVKAIHEFLADQFAVTENNKWEYAELLLMQALNTRLSLVNPFFHNQIKRRIAMITSSPKTSFQYGRKLMSFLCVMITIACFAFSYRTKYPVKDHFPISKPALNLSARLRPDTIPEVVSRKAIFFSKADNLILEADTMIYVPEPTMKPDLKKMLLIVNGEKVTNDIFDTKTIISQQLVFYAPSQAKAIARYGNKAARGVIVFVNAKLLDIPTRQYYAQLLKEAAVKIKTSPDNKIFDRVEISPTFPGGEEKWKQFLQVNQDPTIPVGKEAPKGTYTVVIQFVVHSDGYITDIKPLTKYGYGMEEEAIRLISKGPKWLPAMQNGHLVTAYKRQPISFIVEEENNSSVSFSNPIKTRQLNIFYIGIENPVRIYASDTKPENLIIKISSGTIEGSSGKYIVKVDHPGEVVIDVFANVAGVTLKLGSHKFEAIPLGADFDKPENWDKDNPTPMKLVITSGKNQ